MKFILNFKSLMLLIVVGVSSFSAHAQDDSLFTEELLFNLAPNGTLSQSSTYSYPSSNSIEMASVDRTVDGIISGDLNNIALTLEESNPWWRADLQETYVLKNISIHYPVGYYQEGGLGGYYILMSEFPFLTEDLNSTLANPYVEHVFVESALPSGFEIPLENRHAKYVRVQLVGERKMGTYEIDIFGWSVPDEICDNGIDDDLGVIHKSRHQVKLKMRIIN